MKYRFEAFIIDEESDDIVASVEGCSQESLEEEMGKTKWTGAIERYESEQIPDEIDEDEADLAFQTLKDNEIETRSNAVQDSGFQGIID